MLADAAPAARSSLWGPAQQTLTLGVETKVNMNDRHPFLVSYATLFIVPMAVLILIFAAFELRPPPIAIESHVLRWLMEYKDLYVRYEHAVASWEPVLVLGFLLSLPVLVIESVLRRHQGSVSLGFHTVMAFLMALCSFWAVKDFRFRRSAHLMLSLSHENFLCSKYAVSVIYSSLKNAVLYATVCWIMCRLTRKMNHRTQPDTPPNPHSPSAQGAGGR